MDKKFLSFCTNFLPRSRPKRGTHQIQICHSLNSAPLAALNSHCAARLERLGVSPPPLSINGLSRAKLAHALKQALRNDRLRIHADRMGETVRAENGAARAAELIEQIARQYAGTLIA